MSAAAGGAAAGPNIYLYGIVRWPASREASSLGIGVGSPPREVRAVRSGKVAALVSDLSADEMSEEGVRGMRRDMKAHSAVVNALAAKTTILPARFGVILPDERTLVERVLLPQAPQLQAHLDQLDGTVEVTFRATYIEEQILREVMEARPDLARSSDRGRGRRSTLNASESRIELGRQVAMAIQDQQADDAQRLIDALAPAARNVRVGKPLTDLMVLNASFLVERSKLPKFDRILEKVNAEAGHRLTFDCVGPLPPFSFVDLRL